MTTNTFALRADAAGFTMTFDDLTRPLRALHLLLAGRERRGNFDRLADFHQSTITRTVDALTKTFAAYPGVRFTLGAETVPDHLVGDLGTAPFTVRALTAHGEHSVEWFLFVNPLAERPHMYWGPVIGHNTTSDIGPTRQIQEDVAAGMHSRYYLRE